MKYRMWTHGRFSCRAAAACALGLTALLAVPALGAEIPVKDYAVPVDLTGEGTAWCARYAEDGRMLSVTEVGKDAGEDGQTALAKVFRVDQEMKPLSDAQTVHFTGWQERQQCGDVQMKAKKYTAALDAYDEAVKLDETHAAPASLYVSRGDARIQAGVKAKDLTEDRLEASEADYTTAKSLDAACAGAWLGLADVSIREGNIDGDGGAKAILEEGLAATGNDAGVQAKLDQIVSGNVTDSSGKEHRHSFFKVIDGEEDLVWYYDTTYDSKGREKSVTSYQGTGPRICRIDCLYDNAGRELVSFRGYSDNGALTREVNAYDESGRVISDRIEQPWADDSWLIDTSRTYEYTNEGRIVTEENRIGILWNYSDDLVITKEVRFINLDEDEIWWEGYGKDGNLIAREEFSYDAAGNIILEKTYENGVLTKHEEHDYNEKGRRTEKREYEQGKLVKCEQWDYDAQGREIEVREYKDGTLVLYEQRDYDEYGHEVEYRNYELYGDKWSSTRTKTYYSEDGTHEIRMELYSTSDGVETLNQYWQYIYEDGRLVRIEVHSGNGTLIRSETFS